ncbi:MAG: DUF3343 domain-containing protein [Firmicutes bacterium]|nr:DUF3343 domain-containing protein [Bacillota bacterium]
MYYIFSFRSRNESIGFFERINRLGVSAKLINTPRIISVGCGLSVKVCASCIDTARKTLHICAYETFLGLFYYNGCEMKRIER